jgi:hypothetical protein
MQHGVLFYGLTLSRGAVRRRPRAIRHRRVQLLAEQSQIADRVQETPAARASPHRREHRPAAASAPHILFKLGQHLLQLSVWIAVLSVETKEDALAWLGRDDADRQLFQSQQVRP